MDESKTVCADTAKSDFVWLVIQEGGTSTELYAITYDSYNDAEDYRRRCEAAGSYRTSAPIEVPRAMARDPNFHGIVERVAREVVKIDYASASA